MGEKNRTEEVTIINFALWIEKPPGQALCEGPWWVPPEPLVLSTASPGF